MASEGTGLVPAQRLHNGLNHHQHLFQDESTLCFGCGPPQSRIVSEPGTNTTRELTGFIDSSRYIQPQGAEFRRTLYGNSVPECQNHRTDHSWNGHRRTSATPSGDGSEDEDDNEDDEDDELDETDNEVEGLVSANDSNNKNNSATYKMRNMRTKHLSSLVGSSNEGTTEKPGNGNGNARSTGENHQGGRVSLCQISVGIAEPDGDSYYSQYLQGPDGSSAGQKGMVFDNGCGFSGRKGVSYSSESGDSLRAILTDPLTGALMEDAMILPCGHSFGSGGIQHVIQMKACYMCSQSVSEDSVAPNLSLQAAVRAFRREEVLNVTRASKRRREQYYQYKEGYTDPMAMDHQRGRGVHFPFAVTDRVIIKGNKRTPECFVGREAVVTSQCLNGWYVVKTLDNAESVKLQYRSLAKVSHNPSPKP